MKIMVVGWAVVCILGGLIAVDLLVHLVSALIMLPIFERKPPFNVQPAAPDPGAENIRISTSHGLELQGSLHRHFEQPARGLILFCPELGGNHWSAMSYCQGLWNAGFDILAFDFRNQGESDSMPDYDPLHWLTDYEVKDVLAAIDYVRQRDDLQDLPLGLFGISRGGAAALAAAARCRGIEGVACEGVFSTDSLTLHFTLRWASLFIPGWLLKLIPLWHLSFTLTLTRLISQIRKRCRYTDLKRLVSRLQNTPVLMIAGGRDTYVLPEITEVLCQRIGRNCKGVWVVPQAKHNMARQVEPIAYDRRLVEFFSQLPAAPASSKSWIAS